MTQADVVGLTTDEFVTTVERYFAAFRWEPPAIDPFVDRITSTCDWRFVDP